eukprot:TRINITY_DN10498_c0_g1_i4.p1 TRINITY_DN10498_c0_g1~~TRINITY_DN10498_c0_g1_i4.p1  ORF type:complete len:485 (-),score=41.85 TRINITY_DN10498_c0_g1_i4:198-1652(-)
MPNAAPPPSSSPPTSLSLLGTDSSVARDSAVIVTIPVNIDERVTQEGGDSADELPTSTPPPSVPLGSAALLLGGMDSDSMELLKDIRVLYLSTSKGDDDDCDAISATTNELQVLDQHSGCLEPFSGIPCEFRRRWRHCGASTSIPSTLPHAQNSSSHHGDSNREMCVTGFEVLLFGGELEDDTEAECDNDDYASPDGGRIGNAISELWRLSGVAWWGVVPGTNKEADPSSSTIIPQLYFTSLSLTRVLGNDSTTPPSPRYLSSLVSLGVVSSGDTPQPQHGNPDESPVATTTSTMYVLYGGAQDRADEFPDSPVTSLNDAYLLTVDTTLPTSEVSCTWTKMASPSISDGGNERVSPPKVNGHIGFRLPTTTTTVATVPPTTATAAAVFYGGKENATGNDDFHVFTVSCGDKPALCYSRLPCPFDQSTYATPLEEDGGHVRIDTTNPWPYWRYCAVVCQQGSSISLVGGNCRHADITTMYRLLMK